MNLIQKIIPVLLMINFALGANPKLEDALKQKTTFDVNKIANADNFVESLNAFITIQQLSENIPSKSIIMNHTELFKITDKQDPKYYTENSLDKSKIFDSNNKLLKNAAGILRSLITGSNLSSQINENTDLSTLKSEFDALYKQEIANTIVTKAFEIKALADIETGLKLLNNLNSIVKTAFFDPAVNLGAAGSKSQGKFDLENFVTKDANSPAQITGLSADGLKFINNILTKLAIKDSAGSAALQLAEAEKTDVTKIRGAIEPIFKNILQAEVKDGFIVDTTNPVVKNETDPNKIKDEKAAEIKKDDAQEEIKTIEFKEMTLAQYALLQGFGAEPQENEGKKIKVKIIQEDGKPVKYTVNMTTQGLVIVGEGLTAGGVSFLTYTLLTKDKNESKNLEEDKNPSEQETY